MDDGNKPATCPICGSRNAVMIPHGEVWCEACGWTDARGNLIDK